MSAKAVSVDVTINTATGEGSDSLNTIENVIGSPLNDTLTGNSLANRLAGNDNLDGQAGNDTMIGGRAVVRIGNAVDRAAIRL